MKNIRQIGENILPFVAYGDSAGLPFEAKSIRYMRTYINNFGNLKGLVDISTNPYIGNYPSGTWSDDTHLTIAMARALIYGSGYNISKIANEHIEALEHVNGSTDVPELVPPILSENGKTGWGKGTINAVENLSAGIAPSGSGIDTSGNGVLMKLAPLVYWQVAKSVDPDSAESQIMELTRMTHNNSVAVVSSLTHKKMLEYLILCDEGNNFDKKKFIDEAGKIALKYEHQLKAEAVLSKGLSELSKNIGSIEYGTDLIASLTPKHGFYAPETLIMAYGSFVIENQFPESTFRAIELGGDTDSIGSIVATMSLFLNDKSKLPADYEKIFDYERLKKISKQLAEISLNN